MEGEVKTVKRNAEGMKLVGGDEALFDGVRGLKEWVKAYGGVIKKHGEIWFGNKPFTQQAIRPIGVLSKFLYD